MQADTIAAIATAPGEAGVGMLRISGARAIEVADAVFRAASGKRLKDAETQRVLYGHVVDEEGAPIDEVLALVMRAPHSYTREDVVELSCHGGSIVLRRVLGRVFAAGARSAERGEFTKRAFLSGRLDLSQAQAVMEIVSARTDRALRVAEGHLAGHFSGKIHAMRQKCLGLIAHLEAAIDFPEDEIDDVVIDEVERAVTELRQEIRALLATAHTGRILRDGLPTAIVGKPNVGKSSLMNALLREERAIVTDIPGTTRDSIEEYADIGGVPLRIIDTAGIRETDDAVERIGVEKARGYIERAALVLALFDGAQPLGTEDEEILSLVAGRPALLLLTKSDLPPVTTPAALATAYARCAGGDAAAPTILAISAREEQGLSALAAAIGDFAGTGSGLEEGSFVSDERSAALLRAADAQLGAALKTIGAGLSVDFISIDLRAAWEKLGEITGETVGEDIIDEIFSKFCIGK